MTTSTNLRRVRILALGAAKAKTNDGSGNKTPEDALQRYSF